MCVLTEEYLNTCEEVLPTNQKFEPGQASTMRYIELQAIQGTEEYGEEHVK